MTDVRGTTLNLFPLQAVLLPGAAMELQVFEARYLDLVRECGRTGRGFGVCLITHGKEMGAPATVAAYGTEALIEDFGQTGTGLLTLRIRGHRRFHVERMRVRDNGLQVAEVTWCPTEEHSPVRPEHGLLPVLLETMIEKIGGEHANADQRCFDDADWVGWRLAEVLPLHATHRQELLQMDDASRRLDRLLELVS